jgi:hypothetical protein
VRFEAPASADRCGVAGAGGVVLHGASGGNGVLVWLRQRDSLPSGDWPVLQRTDTVTARGAIVGARFMISEVAHGVPLDSGAVAVTRAGSGISAHVRGSGLEVAAAGRVSVDAAFDAVALGSDTVSCGMTP